MIFPIKYENMDIKLGKNQIKKNYICDEFFTYCILSDPLRVTAQRDLRAFFAEWVTYFTWNEATRKGDQKENSNGKGKHGKTGEGYERQRCVPWLKNQAGPDIGIHLMYGSEIWTLKKADQNRIESFELRVWRRLLGIN